MQVTLQVDQRPKQNHKIELPTQPQESYLLGREFGLMLNQENFRSTISAEEIDPSFPSWRSTSRQRWSDWILEIKKIIFRNISCIALIGLIATGQHAWQEEENRK